VILAESVQIDRNRVGASAIAGFFDGLVASTPPARLPHRRDRQAGPDRAGVVTRKDDQHDLEPGAGHVGAH
jgi:hypothetical protein